jgi:hypothetical protein
MNRRVKLRANKLQEELHMKAIRFIFVNAQTAAYKPDVLASGMLRKQATRSRHSRWSEKLIGNSLELQHLRNDLILERGTI